MWRKWLPFVVVFVIRARFLFSPLSTDEGGYLAVARAWFRGADLYGKVWVDRPQGLLVMFGLLDRVGLGNTAGVRLLATAACFVAMIACGHVAWVLAGEKARLPVMWTVGLALSTAQIEGFIANAELLSCAVGAVGLAGVLLAVWGRGTPDLRMLFLAGIAAGAALTVKQSGFDATFAAAVTVVIAAVRDRWGTVPFLRAAGSYGAGAAAPLSLMLGHAALTGFGDWWWAFAGVRIEHKSALASADWEKLRETGRIVAPLVIVSVVVVAVMFVASLRTQWRMLTVLSAWGAAAVVAFAAGGLFHRHYWMILMFPFATALGIALSRIGNRWVLAAVAVACAAVPAARTVEAVRMDDLTVTSELNADTRLLWNENVAEWFAANAPDRGTVWAMCASSAMYAHLGQDPPFMYSWFEYFRAVPDALPMLRDYLSGDRAPEYVVEVQSARRCDPSGTLGTIITSRYREVGTVWGKPILRLDG